jgi:hypothetical protein
MTRGRETLREKMLRNQATMDLYAAMNNKPRVLLDIPPEPVKRGPRKASGQPTEAQILKAIVALLKRDHGIDVKSASSTVEEMVARQFVERLAKKRGVTLPTGDIFAEGAAAKVKKAAGGKKAEPPPPPPKPSLPPPRLVKTVKAAPVAEPGAEPEVPAAEAAAEAPPVETTAAAHLHGEAEAPAAAEVEAEPAEHVAVEDPVESSHVDHTRKVGLFGQEHSH